MGGECLQFFMQALAGQSRRSAFSGSVLAARQAVIAAAANPTAAMKPAIDPTVTLQNRLSVLQHLGVAAQVCGRAIAVQ